MEDNRVVLVVVAREAERFAELGGPKEWHVLELALHLLCPRLVHDRQGGYSTCLKGGNIFSCIFARVEKVMEMSVIL